MQLLRHKRENPDTELCRSLRHRATSRLYPENETGARYRGKRPKTPGWGKLSSGRVCHLLRTSFYNSATARRLQQLPAPTHLGEGFPMARDLMPRADHHANVPTPDPLGSPRITLFTPVIDRVDRCETMTDTRV